VPRLLSALTILATCLGVASCGVRDIIVKTDLDEKYIIKDSAVTLIQFDWKKTIRDLRKDKKDWDQIYAESNSSYRDCLGSLSATFCTSLYASNASSIKTNMESSGKRLATAENYEREGKDIFKSLRYRPIFVDVNNEKSAMGYVSLTCLNPELSAKESKQIFTILDIKEDEVNKKKTPKQDAYTAVSLEVCKKYAYSATSRFSYNIDEDQSKDKAAK